MLLAIDIGNSTIAFGLFEGQALARHWRLTTDVSRTADEYGLLMLAALEREKTDAGQITGVIISTVVPKLAPTFAGAVQNQLGQSPVFVTAKMDTGLHLSYRNPAELGTDRLANAAVAYARYCTDLIVVDLGTATTFSVVTRTGDFKGGAIAPGLEAAAEALIERTAQLPKVSLVSPEAVIATDTATSLRSGLVIGHAAMVDGLVQRMEQELSVRLKIIATGGFAGLIASISQTIQIVSPFLTLEGLAFLYQRSRHTGSSPLF
jgi:type III pantothenate kinase